MSRKRLAALAGLGAAVLAAAGAAVAAHALQSTQSAAADFAAATVSKVHMTTCTGSDGTYQDTNAWYTGTAMNGPSQLTGTLTIHAHSVLNTTTGLGWLDGDLRIGTGRGATHGQIHAAISGGNAVGAVTGNAPRPGNRLVASFISGFTPSGGFSSGHLGSGSISGAGVIFTNGPCKRQPAPKPFTVAVFRFALKAGTAPPPPGARGNGTLTLNLTRNPDGTIAAATAAFAVSYRLADSTAVSDLALYKGTSKVLDAGITSFPPGQGGVANTVTMQAADATDLLANPRDYSIELDTAAGALRGQLGGPARH